MNQTFVHALLFPMLAVCAASAQAGIVYVDASATGANTGTSWANAYTDLRPALDSAPVGSEIWVAAGTYIPGPTAAESDTFQLKSGVALYGGFAGNETSLTQRDWTAHETTLSGDVAGDDTYVGLPGQHWHSAWNINTSNSAHVVTSGGVDATAILDGFKIANGSIGPSGTPAGSSEMAGGGVYNVGGSPTIRNCTFWRNLSAFGQGGAICNFDGSPSITHCTFSQNWGHLSMGAAIFSAGTGVPVIEDCVFTDNHVTGGEGGGQGQGGAIATQYAPRITIKRCTFELNSSVRFFALSSFATYGGAIDSFLAEVQVENCIFKTNGSDVGGAISTWAPSTIVNSYFENNSAGLGSAVNYFSYSSLPTVVSNCTIVNNLASESAVEGSAQGPVEVVNSILWDNHTLSAGLSVRSAQYHSNVSLRSSCVQGLFTNYVGETTPTPQEVPACIDTDPARVNPQNGDHRLSAASPCIDTGDNSGMPLGLIFDLDGRVRLWNGLGGSGPSRIDMGAYEFGSPLPGACPLIVQHPTPAYVAPNGTTTFHVTTAGDAPFTWQWRKNGIALANGGHVSGATTAALTISPASAADVATYSVVVSNSCGSATSADATLVLSQPPLITRFCFGDGTATACPCGNASGNGDDAGCLNSLGEGGTLSTGGTASISNDTFKLETDLLPDSPSLFFQGTTRVNVGNGVVFGDGLLCAGGSIVRLAVKFSSGGQAVFPDTGEPRISASSALVPGSVRTYQVYYRDAVTFCSNATFNLTNGIEVRWGI